MVGYKFSTNQLRLTIYIYIFFPPFYNIWSHSFCNTFNWHVLISFYNIILGMSPPPPPPPFNLNQITLFTNTLITIFRLGLNNLKCLSMVFSSIQATPFLRNLSFQIIYFLVFPFIYHNILTQLHLVYEHVSF